MSPRKTATAPSAAKMKILVVDDHPMTRDGLVHLINKQADMETCGEAGNPSEALAMLARARPDLVLTDITMPGRSGAEFIKDALAVHGQIPFLVVSMHDELVYAERLLRSGARGYIMKEAGGEKILAAMRHVLSGKVFVSERLSSTMLEAVAGRRPRGSSSPIEKLSDREFEIFGLIGNGKSTREIAAQLHLSPKTVDVHRGNIKEKLALKDATALVRYAVRWVETADLGRDQA